MTYINQEDINFKLNPNKLAAKVIYSPKAKETILIPSSIFHESHEYIVESIDENSFKHNTFINTIDFPKDSKVRSICQKAFSLSNLQSLTIPSSIEKLEKGWSCQTQNLKQIVISPDNKNFKYLDETQQIIVGKSEPTCTEYDTIIFANRDIKKAFIPSTIKYIDSYAFSYCKKLQKVEFSSNSQVLKFGEYSFSYCSFSTFTIPKTVKELQKGWCRGNFQLRTFLFSPENENFKCHGANNELILAKSDSNSDIFDVVQLANRDIKHAIIPESVKYIEPFAFSECRSLISVDFPRNSQLLKIGEGSFSFSHISNIMIPSSTMIIDKYAFFDCNNLQKLVIPSDSQLIKIEKKAFAGCIFNDLLIPSKLKELKENWNYNMLILENIFISSENENFKYLDENNEIIVEKSGIDEIYDTIIFAKHNILNPQIPSSIRFINSYGFSFCSNLQTIFFEDNSQLESIGKWCFFASSIEKIVIPSNITKIRKYTFFRCRRLKTVDFMKDSKLETIEKSAFYNSSVEILTFPSKLKNLDESWSYEVDNLNKILISDENPNYTYYDKSKQMIAGKSDLSSNVYDVLVFACRNIKEVKIPSTIRYINPYAFSHCKKIKTITFEDNSQLLSIGEWGFHSSSIENISIPSNVTSFDRFVFGNCKELKAVEFLSEHLIINQYVFDICTSVRIISIPNCECVSIHKAALRFKKYVLFVKAKSDISLINE